MYDDVLLPTDGSDGTDAALAHALTLAADYDATLHAVYVVDKRLYLAADEEAEREEVVTSLEAEAETALGAVSEAAEERGVEVVAEQRHGVPFRDITAYAEEEGVDLVVMGTHGRTGRDRLANLGSTTERVVKNSEVPVLTVRIPE